LRIILYLLFFVFTCNSNTKPSPPCYPDQGIRQAVIKASSNSNKDEVLSQTINYDQFGKPILRKQDSSREISYNYDGEKLINTIVSNYNDLENKSEEKNLIQSIDTNKVTKNDQFGRALKMRGADGGRIEFTYDGCDIEIQIYYNQLGEKMHEYILHYKNGILIKTIWFTPNNSEGQETNYFSYKFDSKGKWIERKYENPSGERAIEKRTLIYHQ